MSGHDRTGEHDSTRAEQPRPAGEEISIVIPAFNEAFRIGSSLDSMIEYLSRHFERYEILVVDDGSTDRTVEVVEGFSGAPVRCLKNESNRGKGFSVRRGMLAARHDPVLFSDADLSTPIEEIGKLLDRVRGDFDIAIGSRRLRKDQDVQRHPFRKLLGWGFAKLVQLISLRGYGDTQCGFKMFRRHALCAIFPYQRIERWGFDVEILFIARKRGFRTSEVPVRWYQSEGTRLHWLTPLTMLADLLRIRWNDLLGRYRRDPERERQG